ncbi:MULTISPECIES: hypothetical protein [unclassified Acinetobacter]|uniref:hypothetical protein n=1 Tax=unclassified Acinetobacter TaxID=196816 RepID=UPI0015D18136|nr:MULTISPECIES: hypothetical protein [unclassified Acinetobacter]
MKINEAQKIKEKYIKDQKQLRVFFLSLITISILLIGLDFYNIINLEKILDQLPFYNFTKEVAKIFQI